MERLRVKSRTHWNWILSFLGLVMFFSLIFLPRLAFAEPQSYQSYQSRVPTAMSLAAANPDRPLELFSPVSEPLKAFEGARYVAPFARNNALYYPKDFGSEKEVQKVRTGARDLAMEVQGPFYIQGEPVTQARRVMVHLEGFIQGEPERHRFIDIVVEKIRGEELKTKRSKPAENQQGENQHGENQQTVSRWNAIEVAERFPGPVVPGQSREHKMCLQNVLSKLPQALRDLPSNEDGTLSPEQKQVLYSHSVELLSQCCPPLSAEKRTRALRVLNNIPAASGLKMTQFRLLAVDEMSKLESDEVRNNYLSYYRLYREYIAHAQACLETRRKLGSLANASRF